MKQIIRFLLLVVLIPALLSMAGCSNTSNSYKKATEGKTPYPSSWSDQHIRGRD